ncbi:MAG: adenylyltransferase/cytidyltransferase family protein [Clostridiales bacterium]|nr:adenylyltransferase/cytidyltransferase family protein [Clostridiales bacterium]
MKKYKTGYTCGVFDMFHIGHLNILRSAKALCERLIVGVTTDELSVAVKQKKPIIPFEERLEIIRAIRYVDEVVAQEDKNKLDAYFRLKYDCLLVGSDWQGTPQWKQYEKELAEYGVDIVYLPHTDGISSTLLAEKLSEIP